MINRAPDFCDCWMRHWSSARRQWFRRDFDRQSKRGATTAHDHVPRGPRAPSAHCDTAGDTSLLHVLDFTSLYSVAEWLATRAGLRRSTARVQLATATLSGNSLRQTVHTHRASVHQSAKPVAAHLRVVRVTAGLAESSGSLPSGLWLTSPAGWLPSRPTGIGSAIEYGLPLLFYVIKAFFIFCQRSVSFWRCQQGRKVRRKL